MTIVGYSWKDFFRGGDKGALARRHVMTLPEIDRWRVDPFVNLLLQDTKRSTVLRKALGGILYVITLVTLGKFVPFVIDGHGVTFSPIVVRAKRKAGKIYYIWRGAPRYFAGGLVLNMLGFHLLRIASKNLQIWMRVSRRQINESAMASEIVKQGFSVSKNVLSSATLEALNKILDQDADLLKYKRPDHPCGWTKYVLHPGGESLKEAKISHSSSAVGEILSDAQIFQTAEALAGKKIKHTPELGLFEWKVPAEQISVPHQFDFEDMCHADVGYPTYKIFIYLNDVGEGNGAFAYVPYSHRLTIMRIILEYVLSITYYLPNGSAPGQQPHRLTAWFIDKFGPQPIQLTGKENTMVFADVMGFHRRSMFTSTRPRRALFINFRYLEGRP